MKRHAIKKRTIGIVIAVLVGALMITASAALLTYYGKVITTATVSQSVLLDGNDYTTPVTNSFGVMGGCCKCSTHDLENQGCISADIDLATTYSPDGVGITTTYTVQTTDDNTNFGNNEVVAFAITSGLTLDSLFAGAGLSYTYTVLNGGLWNGASPVIVVIDLLDGRHVILYPGWGTRTGTHTLTFSDTVASDTGGNNLVEFAVYDAAFSSGWWGSAPGYPAWTGTKAKATCPVVGTEVVTRIAIQHQAANTGETDQIVSLTFSGQTNSFAMVEGTPFTLQPGELIYFRICYCFDIAIVPGTYTITSWFKPSPP